MVSVNTRLASRALCAILCASRQTRDKHIVSDANEYTNDAVSCGLSNWHKKIIPITVGP